MAAEVVMDELRPVKMDESEKFGNSTIVRRIRVVGNGSRDGRSSEMGVDVGGSCSVC